MAINSAANKILATIKAIFGYNKRYLILSGAVAATIFFVAIHFAHATAIDNISAVYEPIMQIVNNVLFMLMAAAGYVFVTSHLLQWVISHPQWVNLDNPLVQTGLGFTRSFADMLLIVAFLAIALGFIFKIETFQSKKALPKFFIVAILANFAPVFVKMIVDIATVINNTLIINTQGTFISAFDLLVNQMVQSIISLGVFVVGEASASALPPPFSVAAELLSVFYFVGWILPAMVIYIAQFMVAFLIGGILFMYVIFFMSRIFMLQFITIVSPLAVVCYALPQTKHYFDSCWNALIKWNFVGTLVLFLLTLGLNSSKSIMPDSADFFTNQFGVPLQLQSYIGYYIFLFIYMTVIAQIVEQNMPVMANAIKSSFMGLGGMAMSSTIKPGLSAAKQYSFKQKESWDKQAAEAGGASRLTGWDQVKYGASTILAKGLHQADFAISNKLTPGASAGPMPFYSSQNEVKSQADELNKTTFNNPLKGIKNVGDWNKLTSEQKAVRLTAIENDPDKQKKLRESIGETEYATALKSVSISSKLGKETILKHLATASPSTMNATINNPTIQKMILPELLENEETKKMQSAGYGDSSLSQATKNKAMEGILRNLKKPEDIRNSQVGKLIDEDASGEWLTAFMTKVNPSTMAKAWETFTPTQLNKMQTWRDEHSIGYLAETAPHTIQPSGQLNKLLGIHPDLSGDITEQRGKILRERQSYQDLTPEERGEEQIRFETRMETQWRLFDQAVADQTGQTNAGTTQNQGPRPGNPPRGNQGQAANAGPTQNTQNGQPGRQPGGRMP